MKKLSNQTGSKVSKPVRTEPKKMTNEIVSTGPETNQSMYCNYPSNGLNSNQSMFFNTSNSMKGNSSVLCANSHPNVPNDTQLNACSNGFINRILPNYYERVSKHEIAISKFKATIFWFFFQSHDHWSPLSPFSNWWLVSKPKQFISAIWFADFIELAIITGHDMNFRFWRSGNSSLPKFS